MVGLLCTAAARADEVHSVDLHASRAIFSVQHVLIERVTGTVPIVSADIGLGADGRTPTSVEATLDPTHINTGDSDRDGDLAGSDWFDTRKFPVWTFRSSHVSINADGSFAIAGLLTVHGVSVPVTLATSLTRSAPHLAYHATTSVDRHAFGMAITRTDALVGTAIDISIDVQTK